MHALRPLTPSYVIQMPFTNSVDFRSLGYARVELGASGMLDGHSAAELQPQPFLCTLGTRGTHCPCTYPPKNPGFCRALTEVGGFWTTNSPRL